MYKSTINANRFNISFVVYFVICLVTGYYFIEAGLAATALGVVMLTYQSGIELDTEKSRYRNFMKVLGYTLGEWRYLPKIKYVSVVRVLYLTSEVDGSEPESCDYQYKLILAVDDNQRIIKLSTLDKDKALEEAMQIGERLNLGVYDCTTPEKKWIR